MASNKFFTIMIVPEKTQQVKKLIIPNYVFKGGILAMTFLIVLAVIMILDYANVMNQITENKQLKVENRQLRQSVQVFKTKMVTLENTLDRVKTFATKLRIITNIEESGTPANSAPVAPLPAAPVSAPQTSPQTSPMTPTAAPPQPTSLPPDHTSTDTDTDEEGSIAINSTPKPMSEEEAAASKRQTLLAALMSSTNEFSTLTDADNSQFVKGEFEHLDAAYEEVNKFANQEEQDVQFILERLGEKRAMLASTPTRLPTDGYITSDYKIRISPIDGRTKMHEGIDIANRYGAPIISPADGVVTFANVKPGYGKVVIIDHGNGLETVFAHCSRLVARAGQRVHRGEVIAAVGNTGHSTGPHCHYEVRANGLPVDPCWYILDHPAVCRAR